MTQRTNTACHDLDHVCPACEANRTNLWVTLEVLAKYHTDAITPAIYAKIVTLCVDRGTGKGMRDAA